MPKCSFCEREEDKLDRVLVEVESGMTMIGNNVSWIPIYYCGGVFDSYMCDRCIERWCIEEATLTKTPESSFHDYKMVIPLKPVGPNEEGGLSPIPSIGCSGP